MLRSGMARLFLLSILSILLASTVKSQSQCYYPNGQTSPGALTACNKDFEVSMCCANGEGCTPDGLCQNSDQGLWRKGCTDPLWRSQNCTRLCIDGIVQGTSADGTPRADHNVKITQCTINPNTYCCGDGINGTACCEAGNGFRMLNGEALPVTFSTNPTTSSSLTSVSATTSISSLSTSASTSAPNSNQNGSSNNTGPIAGGVVAAIVIIALLASNLRYLVHRRRQQRMLQGRKDSHTSAPSLENQYASVAPMQELNENSRVDELDGNLRAEVGDESRR